MEESNPIEARRTQILEAAAAVFGEKGYQRATMKEIATRAGVAPGTIYLYFAGKRDLLFAIADRLVRRAGEEALRQAAQLDDVHQYITTVLHDRLRFARQNLPLLRALATEVWTDQALLTQFLTQVVAPLVAAGAVYMNERIAQGKIRPARPEIVLPNAVGGLLMLTLLRSVAPNSPLAGLSEDELVEELSRLYLYGLLSSPQEAGG